MEKKSSSESPIRRLGARIFHRIRSIVSTAEPVMPAGAVESIRQLDFSDVVEAIPPSLCTERDTERWNQEWLRYLSREWSIQLEPHTKYPETPSLPADAGALIDFRVGRSTPLSLYGDPEDLRSRVVMEMGCGCGNLGKLLGRYVESYLGVDFSTLALKIADLVSPDNCTYLHVADRIQLEGYFRTVDTIVSRHFWIHQNAQLARFNLEFLADFLKPGGRLYADFFWPNPEKIQGVVYPPTRSLSKAYPSATFRYSRANVDELVRGLPYRIMNEEIHDEMQRRYVVFERENG